MPALDDEFPTSPDGTRRRFLAKAAVGAGAAWVAPAILSSPAQAEASGGQGGGPGQIGFTLGHEGEGGNLDGATSLLVVNTTVTFINTFAVPLSIDPAGWEFDASSLNPVTPLVVRIDPGPSYVVVAIGDTQTPASLGLNLAAFSGVSTAFTLNPGETIAPAFVHGNNDGNASPPVIPFNNNAVADNNYIVFGFGATSPQAVLNGAISNAGFSDGLFSRRYQFRISFNGFG